MGKINLLLVLTFVFCFFIYPSTPSEQATPFWGYNCIDSRCIKVRTNASNIDTVLSLSPCVLMCNEFGTLWPRPTNVTTWNTTLLSIDRRNIMIRKITPNDFTSYWDQSTERFNKIIDAKIGDVPLIDGEYVLSISLYVESNYMELDLDTDEQYQLQIESNGNEIQVVLRAFNYFGARHALETLSQLIVFDEFSSQLLILSNVFISDGPAYKYRGILLDTVSSWFSVDAIKRTLDVMAMSKLNVFHWHITGARSFAMVLDSHADLAQIGAYSPLKVYKPNDIREIVEYARVRGIRIVPEFDTPANIGEGFRFSNVTTCFDEQPWGRYCAAPPCGQLDPTKEGTYELLHDIYLDMNKMFDDPAQFHMGGWDVRTSCWNTSAEVRDWMIDRGWELTHDGYLNLWGYFQDRALAIYRNITNVENKKPLLWTSLLTEDEVIDDYLNRDDYLLQIITESSGPTSHIPHLLEKGYDIIISHTEGLQLNCGFGSISGSGNNWCSPYQAWHLIYDNDFRSMAGNRTSQVLGAVACAWTIEFDEGTLDAMLWPRASAHGERMWSDPNTNFRGAEFRILLHREFLVQYGINAESIQPEWCVQNLGGCRWVGI